MLQSVVLETANPMILRIGDVDPDELLILTSISGLDPADVTLFTGDFARDGGYYQGRRVGQRNPVFNFKINPNYKDDVDASDARAILYRQFLEPQVNSDAVQVRLIDDRNPDRYLFCYTEKLPSDIFVQKPTAQVSTICVDPYLKSVIETSATNAGGWLTAPIIYDGTADTGIQVTIKVVSSTSQIMLENNGLFMKLVKLTPFFAGDIVTINTVNGSRSVKLNGVDIMAILTGDSKWLYLGQAANSLKAYGSAPSDGKAVVTAYSFRSSWWGI